MGYQSKGNCGSINNRDTYYYYWNKRFFCLLRHF